jgi:hypothetical protein
MAATTAYYMPNAAQAPWWFCLGLLFAYWAQAAQAAHPAGASNSVRSVQQEPRP